MESFLRRIAIIFILCMLAVILIFIGINYKSDKDAKNIRKNSVQEINKLEENSKSTSKKSKSKKNSKKKTTTEENKKNNAKEEKKSINNNEDESTNINNNSVDNSNNTDTYSDSSNSYYDSSFIPVTKFSARINNNRLYRGETATITTTIYPDDATIQDVAYSSSNKNIAIVSRTGIVTAVNVGDCYITVSVKNAGSGQIKVHVLPSNNTTYEYNMPSNSYVDSSNETTEDVIIAQPTIPSVEEKEEVISAQPTTPVIDSNTNSSNNTNNETKKEEIIPAVPTTPETTKQTEQTQPTTNNPTQQQVKNGWVKENGKKYYYKDGKKLKDTYVDYIYLDSNGVAKDKVGSFSATLYGATAWSNQKLNMRKTASNSSAVIGTIPVGGKMKILSSEDTSTKYIKVKYSGKEGYVYSDYIYINLPDVIPDAIYEITNANKSIFKSADKNISGVTGKNLYGFSKKYNEKIGKTTYYAPLLYPVAKQFQKAYNKAVKEGYNLKVYDSYRPRSVTQYTNTKFREFYNSDSKVKKAVDYDKDGTYWGPGWFLAQSVSMHNRGVALDLALTNKNGKELSAQTPMGTLDARSVRKYNNSNAKKLSSIMTSAGFETLASEWWHFQEDNYKNSPYTTFKIS